jgi:Cu2+-exporting ATPase
VPAVQVIATGELFRRGILLKSGTALERLAEIDTVVFDKTGTLTDPALALVGRPDAAALRRAATLAACSRHPLARALVAAAMERGAPVAAAEGAVEHPGQGLSLAGPAGETRPNETRLGSRTFCGGTAAEDEQAELWFHEPGRAPLRFAFAEVLRTDAVETVAELRALRLDLHLLSGDRPGTVDRAAATLGLANWQAGCSPVAKAERVEALTRQGRSVLMVGDGLNDGPCLAAASVSMSPASAADISQNVADLVFQGDRLAPVVLAIRVARRAGRVMRQNLALAIGYNALALRLAAAAMSSSSLLVMANSLRLRRIETRRIDTKSRRAA